MLTLRLLMPVLFLLALLAGTPVFAYDKAVEGPDVVLNKLFPKKSKVELDGKFGVVLNQSYQQTFLANAGLTYFWSEEWGFNVEGNFAIASDKDERKCIETFYNDPNGIVGNECGEDDPKAEDPDANWGPAYVPIRELKYIFAGNLVWNPIYGKQIILLSATNYFDFYIAMGGGIAMSDFYRNRPTVTSGNASRGDFCTQEQRDKNECDAAYVNPGTDDPAEIGPDGRPAPEAQSNVLAHFSIGQRFHFMKRFLVTAELKNYTLLGTPDGFENFFTLMGGVGVRF